MLKQSLDKYDVIAIVLVYLGGVPLPEAVRADALITRTIADDTKLLLDHLLVRAFVFFSWPSTAVSSYKKVRPSLSAGANFYQ